MGARYDHLTLDERRLIFRMREARLGVPRIAERLGRHRSTIYRELGRNWHRDAEIREMNGYYPTVAHGVSTRRRYRLGKLQQNPSLATHVIERLNQAWSPEQIAGRLQFDEPHGATICHETIYRFVYAPQGRADALYRFVGYENFVSKLHTGDHEDRPTWMSHVDFSGLKIKLIGSIVAISAIHLLQTFMSISNYAKQDVAWQLAIHLGFVVSGVLLAAMDRLEAASKSKHSDS